MSDLVDRQFNILGKVIRVIGSDDAISLIRKTAMSSIILLSPFSINKKAPA
jgi:hypothetical protein